jgi:DNA repair photolyase
MNEQTGWKGRGAANNPANRFELRMIEPDPEALDEVSAPETEIIPDRSRSILTHNDSPDVGFTWSVNPYRGCEHGCSYCVSGETPILMVDGTTRLIRDLQVGDAIYGTVRKGKNLRYTRTQVLAHWKTVKPAYRITLRDGTELVASGDHRFLTERGWKYVLGTATRSGLDAMDRLLGPGRVSPSLLDSVVESSADLRVVSVEPLGREMELFDITTGTEDFIANGVISHNCYARPFHEYLGFSAGLDFETKIIVKEDAPDLLRKELSAKKWVPEVVALSGVTDAYQPLERRLRITRGCLEVFAEFRNPVGIITKNALVVRDADLLGDLARDNAALVTLSVTTLDKHLAGVMEPRASRPHARLEAIRALTAAGVPVGVMVAPIIPGLNDHEIPAILAAVAEAGAKWAGYVMLRLPHGVADLFSDWLERHFPEHKEKVLGRVREMRGGKLHEGQFGKRMRGEGVLAEQIRALFHLACRRAGLGTKPPVLSTAAFRSGRLTQGMLFEV